MAAVTVAPRHAEPVRLRAVFVKICGITNEDDALLATALGADALGFVFAPSVRQVQPADVRDIVRRLPHEVTTVGVFRNERPERDRRDRRPRSGCTACSCTVTSRCARCSGSASGCRS